ncbi:TDT family transporter [Rhodobacteraceae bacterium CH30]|uniref:C4-dicarboxylate ABC transporter n=2 Tax=Craterilacuibacter sinensis TaxID=2686017 RepID=A0A845BTI0_9NEIS|nr:C4-dicarboxylate ABC transporter [Craterilacuibacter sinensis]RQW25946.1 TDT family transporter [Rhodobacteraceae bacterium CH30]
MGGLALGIASLGWCWENFMPAGGMFQLAGAAIASILLLSLLLKFIHAPQLLCQDLAHPVVGSVVPTMAMALMIVAKALSLFSLPLALTVWLLAIGLHLAFLATFIWHRARDFRLHHMVPSWFVPPVGIIVAAVSFPGGGLLWLAQGLVVFGLACYLVMLPLMIYRLVFACEVPDQAKPTLAILAAPASLALAGYLTVVQQPSPLLVGLLAGIAVLMTSVIYLFFLRLLRLPFSPGYAAFTFPMVIGATALYKLSAQLGVWGFADEYVAQLHALADFELWIAALVVGYVSWKFLRHYLLAGLLRR